MTEKTPYTSKERLNLVLNHQKTDRLPCICPGGMMNMITQELMERAHVALPDAHKDSMMMASLSKAAYDNQLFDNCGVPFCMTVEAESLGAPVDFGNEIYEPHVTGYVINSAAEVVQLKPVNPETGRMKVVTDAIRILKNDCPGVPIVGNLTGPVSTASSLLEPMIFYKEMAKKPELVHQFMEFVTQQLISFAEAQIQAGADIIAISDPSATGEILGPSRFETFAVPYLNQLVACGKAHRIPVIVHICGQMRNVYDQVGLVNSDVLSFDSIVSIREAKTHLPNRILMGNVSTYALEFGTPEKVHDLTLQCMQNGVSILSPACGLGMKSPLRNIQEILRTAKEVQHDSNL